MKMKMKVNENESIAKDFQETKHFQQIDFNRSN